MSSSSETWSIAISSLLHMVHLATAVLCVYVLIRFLQVLHRYTNSQIGPRQQTSENVSSTVSMIVNSEDDDLLNGGDVFSNNRLTNDMRRFVEGDTKPDLPNWSTGSPFMAQHGLGDYRGMDWFEEEMKSVEFAQLNSEGISSYREGRFHDLNVRNSVSPRILYRRSPQHAASSVKPQPKYEQSYIHSEKLAYSNDKSPKKSSFVSHYREETIEHDDGLDWSPTKCGSFHSADDKIKETPRKLTPPLSYYNNLTPIDDCDRKRTSDVCFKYDEELITEVNSQHSVPTSDVKTEMQHYHHQPKSDFDQLHSSQQVQKAESQHVSKEQQQPAQFKYDNQQSHQHGNQQQQHQSQHVYPDHQPPQYQPRLQQPQQQQQQQQQQHQQQQPPQQEFYQPFSHHYQQQKLNTHQQHSQPYQQNYQNQGHEIHAENQQRRHENPRHTQQQQSLEEQPMDNEFQRQHRKPPQLKRQQEQSNIPGLQRGPRPPEKNQDHQQRQQQHQQQHQQQQQQQHQESDRHDPSLNEFEMERKPFIKEKKRTRRMNRKRTQAEPQLTGSIHPLNDVTDAGRGDLLAPTTGQGHYHDGFTICYCGEDSQTHANKVSPQKKNKTTSRIQYSYHSADDRCRRRFLAGTQREGAYQTFNVSLDRVDCSLQIVSREPSPIILLSHERYNIPRVSPQKETNTFDNPMPINKKTHKEFKPKKVIRRQVPKEPNNDRSSHGYDDGQEGGNEPASVSYSRSSLRTKPTDSSSEQIKRKGQHMKKDVSFETSISPKASQLKTTNPKKATIRSPKQVMSGIKKKSNLTNSPKSFRTIFKDGFQEDHTQSDASPNATESVNKSYTSNHRIYINRKDTKHRFSNSDKRKPSKLRNPSAKVGSFNENANYTGHNDIVSLKACGKELDELMVSTLREYGHQDIWDNRNCNSPHKFVSNIFDKELVRLIDAKDCYAAGISEDITSNCTNDYFNKKVTFTKDEKIPKNVSFLPDSGTISSIGKPRTVNVKRLLTELNGLANDVYKYRNIRATLDNNEISENSTESPAITRVDEFYAEDSDISYGPQNIRTGIGERKQCVMYSHSPSYSPNIRSDNSKRQKMIMETCPVSLNTEIVSIIQLVPTMNAGHGFKLNEMSTTTQLTNDHSPVSNFVNVDFQQHDVVESDSVDVSRAESCEDQHHSAKQASVDLACVNQYVSGNHTLPRKLDVSDKEDDVVHYVDQNKIQKVVPKLRKSPTKVIEPKIKSSGRTNNLGSYAANFRKSLNLSRKLSANATTPSNKKNSVKRQHVQNSAKFSPPPTKKLDITRDKSPFKNKRFTPIVDNSMLAVKRCRHCISPKTLNKSPKFRKQNMKWQGTAGINVQCTKQSCLDRPIDNIAASSRRFKSSPENCIRRDLTTNKAVNRYYSKNSPGADSIIKKKTNTGDKVYVQNKDNISTRIKNHKQNEFKNKMQYGSAAQQLKDNDSRRTRKIAQPKAATTYDKVQHVLDGASSETNRSPTKSVEIESNSPQTNFEETQPPVPQWSYHRVIVFSSSSEDKVTSDLDSHNVESKPSFMFHTSESTHFLEESSQDISTEETTILDDENDNKKEITSQRAKYNFSNNIVEIKFTSSADEKENSLPFTLENVPNEYTTKSRSKVTNTKYDTLKEETHKPFRRRDRNISVGVKVKRKGLPANGSSDIIKTSTLTDFILDTLDEISESLSYDNSTL